MQIPRQPQPLYTLHSAKSSGWPGLVRPGNIDLLNRPMVRGRDGSISTVRSLTFTDDRGRALLLPSVVGGRIVSDQQALAHYHATGQHLGFFRSNAAAERYAQALHVEQMRLYTPRRH